MNKPTRQQIWKHNALFGCVKMAQVTLDKIFDSPTTTRETREQAATLIVPLDRLYQSLKTRKDQEKK